MDLFAALLALVIVAAILLVLVLGVGFLLTVSAVGRRQYRSRVPLKVQMEIGYLNALIQTGKLDKRLVEVLEQTIRYTASRFTSKKSAAPQAFADFAQRELSQFRSRCEATLLGTGTFEFRDLPRLIGDVVRFKAEFVDAFNKHLAS